MGDRKISNHPFVSDRQKINANSATKLFWILKIKDREHVSRTFLDGALSRALSVKRRRKKKGSSLPNSMTLRFVKTSPGIEVLFQERSGNFARSLPDSVALHV